MKILCSILVFIQISASIVFAQENPRIYFGDNYVESIKLLQQVYPDLSSHIIEFELNPIEVIAVLFPELIRYNRFMNFMETSVLELLYEEMGSAGPDFSIGYFQMKPAFAEKVEELVLKNRVDTKYQNLTIKSCGSIKNQRKIRLQRLKDPIWQLDYACAYIEYQLSINPGLLLIPQSERIAFLATAYNTTFGADFATITERISIKTFPYGMKFSNPFTYADVSNYFAKNDFLNFTKNNKKQ